MKKAEATDAMDHAVALTALAAEGRLSDQVDLFNSLTQPEREAVVLALPGLCATVARMHAESVGCPPEQVPSMIRAMRHRA